MGTRFRILNHFLVGKFGVFQGWFRIFLQFSGILLAKCAGFFQSHFVTLTSLSGGNCLKMFAVAFLSHSWHDRTVWFTKNLGFLRWIMLIGQAMFHFGGRGGMCGTNVLLNGVSVPFDYGAKKWVTLSWKALETGGAALFAHQGCNYLSNIWLAHGISFTLFAWTTFCNFEWILLNKGGWKN